MAGREIGKPGIGDVLLPAHLKLPELGKLCENGEAAIGELAFPAAEVEFLEAGQAREMRETGVGELQRVT